MDMGVGFSEILLILILILVFFGSKELPHFMREGARLIGKLRGYSDKVKRELNDMTSTMTNLSSEPQEKSTAVRKEELRVQYLAARKALSPEERAEKTKLIHEALKNTPAFKKATSILLYVEMEGEVATRTLIEELLRAGKRVAIPYLKKDLRTLGIAAITDLSKDVIPGELNTPEPRFEIRDNFFRSDLQLIVCPGVAFDLHGSRLGRGKAYYDNFLRELKERVPIFGIGFECQFMSEMLPFSYSDVIMDQVITENGCKLPYGTEPEDETAIMTPDAAVKRP